MTLRVFYSFLILITKFPDPVTPDFCLLPTFALIKNENINIVLTGSLGNTGKPLAEELVHKGHAVTVISSNPQRAKDIRTLGAKAAIGSVLDLDFLTGIFTGADIVYLVAMPQAAGNMLDKNADFIAPMHRIGENYKAALAQSGVKRVIHLSSVGAHLNKGNGMLFLHHDIEHMLQELPADVSIKFMRPVGFYTNLFRSLATIKANGVLISNYGGDQKEPWVSPLDIAAAVVEEMEAPFDGRTVRYIASEELSPNEIAKTLGGAIGLPGLKWQVISGEALLNGMLANGLNPQLAAWFVEMQESQGSGALYEDYYRHKPPLGKVKLAGFAKEFAQVYNNF